MKRASLASLLLFLLAYLSFSSAHAELVPARVILGGREAVLDPAPVFDGTRVLAPLALLDQLGASHIAAPDGKSVTVTAAGGQSRELRLVKVNDAPMIPVNDVLDLIGGEPTWDPKTHTLTLKALLESIEFVDGALKINCSFPVTCSIAPWTSANRLIVDVSGAKLATEAKEVYIGAPPVVRARLGQFSGDTARVVLDLEKKVGFKLESKPLASQVVLKVSENVPGGKVNGAPGEPMVFTIQDIRVEPVDTTRFNVIISTSGKGKSTPMYSPKAHQVALNLPGGTITQSLANVEGSHPMLSGLKIIRAKTARIEMDLKRAMVADVSADENTITVNVRPPDKSGGRLAGKLVVVDAGHGGQEKGALCRGVCEKDVNLKIAGELCAALERQGARTMLTRAGDERVGLAARSEVAINNNADFFISVHCNSSMVANGASGIETYYHMQEPSPRLLAFLIHDAVCSATGMCDRSPRSDRSLYVPGLAVLRRLENTGIPGILLECGYLNNSSDRAKLLDAGYRKKLAGGIVAGLKAYVEGLPTP